MEKPKKKGNDCQWILVVLDPYTNECVAAELSRQNKSSGNEINFLDEQRIERNGWIVTHQVLQLFLNASKCDRRIKVLPFVKEGGGKIKLWTIPKKKKVSAKLQKAKEDLAMIVDRRKKSSA